MQAKNVYTSVAAGPQNFRGQSQAARVKIRPRMEKKTT
jgi:hypothetical protein